MNRLVVFDLDGTLVDTNVVDDRCYERAVCETLALPPLDRRWSRYTHVSDTGIAIQAYTEVFGRAPVEEDLLRATTRFVDLLEEQHRLDPSQFAPIDGVAALIAELPKQGWDIAIATGGWRPSAYFKLRVAGLGLVELPFASTEDGPARVDIVRAAVDRATIHYGREEYERIVSVGDGAWDVAAAREMKLPFLGVGRGPRAERLRLSGATSVIGEFTDVERVVELLATVGPPAAPSLQMPDV